jgi:hypothetical protein
MDRHCSCAPGNLALAVLLLGSAVRADPPPPNSLSEGEKADGWKLLFDGRTTSGWRAYRGDAIPDKWKIIDGAFVVSPKNGKRGGDIATDEQFGDFELSFEWKVTPGANSGVMYHVGDDEPAPFFSGPEYQILDNREHPDGRSKLTSAASCYGLYAPSEDATKPVGEWNGGRILVHGNQVEHWLNGKKVVAYELGSDDFRTRVGKSRFKDWKRYGAAQKGRIALQDHGDEVFYRNLKIKALK